MDKYNFNTWPSYSREEIAAVSNTLLTNKVNYWTGDECHKFEHEFSLWSEAKYSVAVSNGSVALELSLKAIEIKPKDEVIVTSRTFIASVSSIVNVGATPIFADVDLDSQNINLDTIQSLISNKTKAIVCVHLAGWPCEMDQIIYLANKLGLYVIEDCSQAHGAKYKGRPVGSIGDIGCWSFCQDKIISTGGEGGMVTTSNERLWQKIWSFKDHGKGYEAMHNNSKMGSFKWVHESFGTNYRMTEMQAAIGRIQLKKINQWHKKRLNNANMLWNCAKKIGCLRVPNLPNYIEHAAYKCYVFVLEKELKNNWSRDRIIKEINLLGVPCFSGACPEVYLEKAFDNSGFRPKTRLENAKTLGETSLMFLIHPTLTQEEMNFQCKAITNVMSQASLK
jgi:dTDP-4-amino-4,6-dideoxygalactose transaminase